MSAGDGWCFTPPSAQPQMATFSSHPSTYTKSGETETRDECWNSKGHRRREGDITKSKWASWHCCPSGKDTSGKATGRAVRTTAPSRAPGLLTQTAPAAWNPLCRWGLAKLQDPTLTLTLKCTNTDLNGKEKPGWLTTTHFQCTSMVEISRTGSKLWISKTRVWMSSISLLLLLQTINYSVVTYKLVNLRK